ncbi:MAG: PAS domain-containing protein [Lachnospiraceae bacterium]|nr:PAS domain-containing protein [Lachnospiraceae bacterium]
MQIREAGQQIIPRIMRDMNDGVLVLDMKGHILYLNEQGRRLLGVGEKVQGDTYRAAFLEKDTAGVNDGFHQFVLDAVYNKEKVHSGEAAFRSESGESYYFQLTSSFLRDEDGVHQIGVVVLFSDVTQVHQLNVRRRESSVVFAVLMVCVCTYIFLWSLLRFFGAEPAPWVMNLMIEAISVGMFLIILKMTSFSVHDIGLRVSDKRATFLPAVLISAGVSALMVAVKLLMLRTVPGYFPQGASFWDWRAGSAADLFYPLTVILQEFLARGVMQENLKRIFTGKYAAALSIFVSALIFGVLHVAHGLPSMIGASLLLGVLGIMYQKQGNIWGLCVIHYVLGEVGTFLGFVV